MTPQFLESYPLGIQLRLPRLQLAPLGLEAQSSGLQFLAAPLELFRFHAEVFLRGASCRPPPPALLIDRLSQSLQRALKPLQFRLADIESVRTDLQTLLQVGGQCILPRCDQTAERPP